MHYHRILVSAAIVCLAALGHVVAFVGPLIVAPLMYLVRDAPAAALHLFVVSIKPAAFRMIGLLAPEYRESWLTDGQSLGAT